MRTKTSTTNKLMSIGHNHHFLLLQKKCQNSLRKPGCLSSNKFSKLLSALSSEILVSWLCGESVTENEIHYISVIKIT